MSFNRQSALAFAAPLAFWPGLMSAAVAPRWALLAVGLPAISWLDPRRLAPVPGALVAGIVGWAALSLIWTPEPVSAVHDLIRLLIFIAAILVGAGIDSLAPIMRAMGWGVAVSSALVLIQLTGWSPVDQAIAPAGLFYNRDFLAELAAILFVWAVCSREFALVAFLAIPLAVCASRVALISAGLAFVAFRPRQALLPLLLTGAALAAVMFQYPDKAMSALNRVEIWQSAFLGISFWGNGLGSFSAAHQAWEYAHSDLLQSFYEIGVGGLALIGLFALALRATAAPPLRAATACLATQIAIAFPLHLPVSTALAGLLVGHVGCRRDTVCGGRFIGGAYLGARA